MLSVVIEKILTPKYDDLGVLAATIESQCQKVMALHLHSNGCHVGEHLHSLN